MQLIITKSLINEFLEFGLDHKNNFNMHTEENELFFEDNQALVKEIVKIKYEIAIFEYSLKFTYEKNNLPLPKFNLLKKSKGLKNYYILQSLEAEDHIFQLSTKKFGFNIEDIENLQKEIKLEELIEERKNHLKELMGMYAYYSIRFIKADRIGLSKDGKIYISDYSSILYYLFQSKFEISMKKETK